MKPEAQRIAIAKVHLGYKDFDNLLWCDEEMCPKWEGRKLHGSSDNTWHQVPDYLNSRDAMAEVEALLTNEQWSAYYNELYFIVVRDSPEGSKNILRGVVSATAAQRLEAVLKTLKLWKADDCV